MIPRRRCMIPEQVSVCPPPLLPFIPSPVWQGVPSFLSNLPFG